jgi:hypothetical protein
LIPSSVDSNRTWNSFPKAEERICCSLASSEYKPIRIILLISHDAHYEGPLGRSNIGENVGENALQLLTRRVVENPVLLDRSVVVPRRISVVHGN